MGPPNSSPLRQRVDARRCRSSSPTTDRKGLGDGEADKETLLGPPGGDVEHSADAVQNSSDFGDDDLDQDLMDLADASTDPFVEPVAAHNEFDSLGSSAWSSFAANKMQSSHPKQPPTVDTEPPIDQNDMNNETKHDDSDDFDDDYSNFADDFQEILAECDGKPDKVDSFNPTPAEQQAVKNDTTAAAPAAEAEFSGDEFDDDFDLAAIEQSMKQAGGDGAHVCHS